MVAVISTPHCPQKISEADWCSRGMQCDTSVQSCSMMFGFVCLATKVPLMYPVLFLCVVSLYFEIYPILLRISKNKCHYHTVKRSEWNVLVWKTYPMLCIFKIGVTSPVNFSFLVVFAVVQLAVKCIVPSSMQHQVQNSWIGPNWKLFLYKSISWMHAQNVINDSASNEISVFTVTRTWTVYVWTSVRNIQIEVFSPYRVRWMLE